MRTTTTMLSIVCLSVLLCLSGCGYASSGTWEDDAGNWGRAFRSVKPDDVVVVHSRYWRSPHWSYEFEYFFEIGHNDQLKKQLFTQNKLIQLEGKAAAEAKTNFFSEPPKWFAPRAVESYEVWTYESRSGSNFRVFVDKETGDLFLSDHQV